MGLKIYLSVAVLIFSCSAMMGQSVGLVLSGGGAKGLSHVGVIKALEEYNIPIDYICGTSMGAIVGSLYAAGLTPDEMLALFKSREFAAWYKGEPERASATYFYRDAPDAGMVSFAIARKKEEDYRRANPFDLQKRPGLKIDLPTSIVSPYPMDLALIEVFAPASVAAGDNFDNLMVPFFCIAADVKNKKPLVMRKGNLGSAVRASMTYPFIFRPITIDSTLLFDGGFYNNFPWDVMLEEYAPDFIIGSKCVTGDNPMDEDDIATHVANMLVSQTNYTIPPDKGIVIERKYPYGVMDFHKVDEIVESGYRNTLLYIEEIKERVKRERTPGEVDSMRIAFRGGQRALVFSPEVEICGNVDKAGKELAKALVVKNEQEPFSYDDLKKGYYKAVATGRFKTFYPYYTIGKDSLLTLKIRASKSAAWSLSVGGNISSSSLNQGFIGASYSHLSRYPWKVSAGVNMGKYYKGGYLFWRHDVSIWAPVCYSLEMVGHQFDYYNGNQNLFAADRLPDNIRQSEYYGRANLVVPLAMERNLLLQFGAVAGVQFYKYYQNGNYISTDIADKTSITLFCPMAGIVRNTLDYSLYPTSGRHDMLMFRYNCATESFAPGGILEDWSEKYGDKMHHKYILKAYSHAYFRISGRFSLGYMADLTISNRNSMANYISTMLYMPAFRPVPHSNTLILEKYRANSYLGVGISPVILLANSLFLHGNISWFQPYENIEKLDDGGYRYSDAFPRGAFLANAAVVWQSPIGPVSFAATYYEKSRQKWYPQLNIGFLLFKKRSLEF